MKRCLLFVDNVSQWSGRIIAPLILAMMAIVLYEVVARFIFGQPTKWAHETSAWLWGAMFILGGGYCLLEKKMVNVDIVVSHFPPRGKAAIEAFSFLALLVCCGTLIWYGSMQAWHSIEIQEHSQTVFGPPLYPMRALIPIGAFLILIQGLSKFINDIYFASTGKVLK